MSKEGKSGMDEKQEMDSVSTFRRYLPQVLAVAAKNTLSLNFGLSVAFPTMVIPDLMRPDSEFHMSTEQISWMGSLFLLVIPFGCLASGPCIHRFGRRTMMLVMCGPFSAAWLIFYFANSAAMLYAAVIVHGLVNGLLEAPIHTYVAEVSQPDIRGILSSTTTSLSLVGVFIQFFIGNFLDWRRASIVNVFFPLASFICIWFVPESPHWLILTYVGEVCEPKVRGPMSTTHSLASLLGVSLQFLIGNLLDWKRAALVNAILPLISFLSICCVPESPHWLAGQGREKEAEKGLMWLRGWVGPSAVKEELDLLKLSVEGAKGVSPFAWISYMNSTFFKPFSLVVFSFFVGHFGGMSTLQTYAVSIFESIDSPIGAYKATAIEGFIQLSGAVVCAAILPFIGRRVMALTCTIGSGICLLTLALVGTGWSAVSLLLISVFFINTCSKIFPWVLIGEVFTPTMRAVASGMASCVGYAMGFLVNKTWFVTLDLLTLQGVFILYASVSFIGAVTYFFVLPETEGRSLDEVQAHFKGEVDLTKSKHGKHGLVHAINPPRGTDNPGFSQAV